MFKLFYPLIVCFWLVALAVGADKPASKPAELVTLNARGDGYRGIWYMNQGTRDEFVYKYSGGLGTYCAKHMPFAVYCPQAEKTFFCYGGTTADSNQHLLHMVSFYDHKTKQVPRPTILLDKQTNDAHDNPVISVDAEGYVWIFSTSHGTSRPSTIHRSVKPYDVSAFERINATRKEGDKEVPIDNFSYAQSWYVPGQGFVFFFTKYGYPAPRTNCFMSSPDGIHWSEWIRLAAIEQGHYQTSAVNSGKAGTAFNYHPQKTGLNWRTNLYYMETVDSGKSWRTVDGRPLDVPLREVNNPALVHDFQKDGLLVYLKDITFDFAGRPVILVVTSKGWEPGPKNDPRMATLARWTGTEWHIRPIAPTDHNYDMCSLYIEQDGTWRMIGSTAPGPQPYSTGGEMEMWISRDEGETWTKSKTLTHDSRHNHTHARRPVNAHPDFYALWADGHALKPSASSLYFCDREGNVYMLPREMTKDWAVPRKIN